MPVIHYGAVCKHEFNKHVFLLFACGLESRSETHSATGFLPSLLHVDLAGEGGSKSGRSLDAAAPNEAPLNRVNYFRLSGFDANRVAGSRSSPFLRPIQQLELGDNNFRRFAATCL